MRSFSINSRQARRGRWLRTAAAASLAAVCCMAGCAVPEMLKPDEGNAPINIHNREGFSTREVVYRGWDHAFRVSDGNVEMIFVPSIGRMMRFAPVEPDATAQAAAQALTSSASPDDKNLCWVNPKWTGLVPTPGDVITQHEHPREYWLFGGLQHWCGPQEKWPASKAPDLRRLVDVEVAWPPDPGCDVAPFKYVSGDAGKVRFEGSGHSVTGLQPGLAVEVMPGNLGVLNFRYSQTNGSKVATEASSWVALTLRQRGYIAVRRDQLKDQPALWPAGTEFAGPWAILPLDSRPDGDFELAIDPLPEHTAHVVILHEKSIYSLQVQRAAGVNYPAGRTAMTVKRGVIGCPPQVELADPECDEHYEVGACSPLVTLEPGKTVDLNLRMVSKSVETFDLAQLKAYLVKAVETETIAPLPAPHVSGGAVVTSPPPTTAPAHSPDETTEFPPPLPAPDTTTPPGSDVKPPQSPGPQPPAVDPHKPPPMGPVNG